VMVPEHLPFILVPDPLKSLLFLFFIVGGDLASVSTS